MSQNYEESPESDSKMDISESATSLESVSPVAENLHDEYLNGTMTPTNNIVKQTTQEIPFLDNDSVTQLRPQQNSNMLRSELTVAPYHPLMSPPGTDSDSENGHKRVFNFPDVIPNCEQPLRLVNPHSSILSNSNSITTNCINKKLSPNILDLGSMKTLNSKKINNSGDGNILREQQQYYRQRKIPILRAPSPDLISSESEQELSQYQANVEPVSQSVALISNNFIKNNGNNSGNKNPSPLLKPLQRRKIQITSDILCDDISSLDSISNHSFEDDVEPNLASISPSSSFMDDDFGDDHDEFDDDFCDITPTNVPSDPIPTYAADEERRDSRNWQKITLPDGRSREIDMRVIEPYKRVLSHGGYLKAGGHNAIVMFSACHLPDRSRADYHYVMDNLFLYVVKTLEQLVTEDYVLVYLHGGSSRRNVPPFPWLKKCYQLLDRRLRKSLRNLYLVHPTFWLKSVVWMSRPFVSSKFWRKLVYVKTLEELYSLVSVEKTSIPEKVKNYDTKFK